jgi:hypothetical protein
MNVPKAVIADGGLGLWAAIRDLGWPSKEQRCWNHKICNVQDALPKREQKRALTLLRAIPQSETLEEAVRSRDVFLRRPLSFSTLLRALRVSAVGRTVRSPSRVPTEELPMGTRDPRIDAYIEKSAAFARPILVRMRALVHEGCPDVRETLKWRNPSFEYEGLLAGMAAFKQHCAFGFWKHELVVGDDEKAGEAMGSFGRITKVSELPPKAKFLRYVEKAMRLNEQGVKAVRAKTVPKGPPEDAPRAEGRAREEREGAQDVRGVPAEPEARVPRLGGRRQDRCDARAPRGPGRRVDGRGQAPELEVRAEVSARSRA